MRLFHRSFSRLSRFFFGGNLHIAPFSLLALGILPLAGTAQVYNPTIDVQHYDFSLRLSDHNDQVEGTAVVTVRYTGKSASCWLDLARKPSGFGSNRAVTAE